MNNKTLDYYNKNANTFISHTKANYGGAMKTYILEMFDGKKQVGKEKSRTDDYDDVLKRVNEIVTRTNHREEIWDSVAYKHRDKGVCR